LFNSKHRKKKFVPSLKEARRKHTDSGHWSITSQMFINYPPNIQHVLSKQHTPRMLKNTGENIWTGVWSNVYDEFHNLCYSSHH
jgi:hypothetical protein